MVDMKCMVPIEATLSRSPARRFDNVYIDSELRVSKDSRGDTLVVQRVGPPRPYGSD